jgi:hypothetical protein
MLNIRGVTVKRYLETVLMLLLIIIGVIPLIADCCPYGDTHPDNVAVLTGFNAAADAAGFTTSISGNLSSAPAEKNRLMLVVLHYEVPDGTGAAVKSVTIGGLPTIPVAPEMTVRQRVWAGYIKESDIATLTGTIEVVANFDPAPTYAQARVAMFAHVDQTTPIASVISNGSDTPAQDIDFGPTPLTVQTSDVGFYFLNSADTTTSTQTPPQFFNESFEALADTYFDAGAGELVAWSDFSITGAGMKLENAVRYGVLALSLRYLFSP